MYAPVKPDPMRSRRQQPKRRRRRRSSPWRRLSKHTVAFEMSARIAVNGILVTISLSTLGQLIPYIQTQAEQLKTVKSAVATAETSTSQLKEDFGRYFDPWQTKNVIQEQSGYKSSTERQIVWTDPTRDY